MNRPSLSAALIALSLAAAAHAADPITLWNANLEKPIAYQPITPTAKPGDFVYVDARLLHPTQFCLGYREVNYKSKLFSALPADKNSHDPKASTYAYLAKKDIPILIGDDGTFYLTDGHHTLAALLASTQPDKTAFGHIVANFYGKPRETFLAFLADPKNNDVYLFGPNGNGLLQAPAALPFDRLPTTVYGANESTRMANDLYRSLGWAMKETGYTTKPGKDRDEDETLENFIEFRWADLFRNKILWNNDSDDAFYLAAENADTLAHSEFTADMTGGFAARDMPGFLRAKKSDAFALHITDEACIEGDILPSALSTNTLTVDTSASLIITGRLEHLASVRINAGGQGSVKIEKGDLVPNVKIPAGRGTVVFAGNSAYSGPTTVSAGTLIINGALADSPITINAGATLRGSGTVNTISGPGTIWPGSSTGILKAAALDPADGTSLTFEFAAPKPAYDHPTNSRNDLLILTANAPILRPFESTNSINIYLHVDSIKDGDTFLGGIFVDSDFKSAVREATVHAYLADPLGKTILAGTHYTELDPSRATIKIDVIPETAALPSGTQKGFITRFTVHGAK